MRLVPNTDIAPKAVNRYLLPWERRVIVVHRHPAVLLAPIGMVIAGLVGAIVLTILYEFSGDALLIVWLIWGLFLLYLAWKTANWSVNFFVVSAQQRLLITKGFLTREVATLPSIMITSMKFRRSMLGRLLGYGQFIFECRGQYQAVWNIRFIPYPEQIFLELRGLGFPDPEKNKDLHRGQQ